jgi:hypothetical protein
MKFDETKKKCTETFFCCCFLAVIDSSPKIKIFFHVIHPIDDNTRPST